MLPLQERDLVDQLKNQLNVHVSSIGVSTGETLVYSAEVLMLSSFSNGAFLVAAYNELPNYLELVGHTMCDFYGKWRNTPFPSKKNSLRLCP